MLGLSRSSIFYSITFIFILGTAGIGLAFLWLMDYDKQNYTNELNTRYSISSNATLYKLSGLMSESEYKNQMENFNMHEISDPNQIEMIKTTGVILQEITTKIGTAAIILYNKHHFVMVKHTDKEVLLQDLDYQPYRYDIIKVIFGLVFLILLITYIFIIQKIKPLRKLKREINKFASGDLNIKDVSRGKDEISDVASAFYNSVMQIKRLNESRALFLRNIMHELKTPITKGRITVEMIEKNKYQERLISVFEKLEELINEFAAVERATAIIDISDMSECSLNKLIKEAINIAMVDSSRVENLADNIRIKADFKLLSIAIKNIIDNAMKYSDDKKVKIFTKNGALEFYTLGEEMSGKLEYYIEPFTKGDNAKQSFGLGLYIVDSIVKAHGMKFSHRYEDGYNVFSFDGIEKLSIKELPNLEKIDEI